MGQLTFKNLFESEDLGYSIPEYQRAYAWRKEQLSQFIADLEEQPVGKSYYLGHFLFEKKADTAAHGRLNIIDGQQRITTTIIFFSALCLEYDRRALNGEPALDSSNNPIKISRIRERYLMLDERQRLRIVSDDNNYFERAILRQEEDVTPLPHRKSQSKISFAFNFFKTQLAKQTTKTLQNWQYLIEQAGITRFEVNGIVEATQIFAFQNDRGIGLSELEKLKAYLMHRAYLDDLSGEVSETIKHVQHCFGEIFKQTERITLREDTVLSYHNKAFGSGDTAFEHVKSTLASTQPKDRPTWLRKYASELLDSFIQVEHLESLSYGQTALTGVLHLGAGDSWALLLRIQRHHRDNEDMELRERLFRLMEITLFKLTYTVGSYRTNYFPWLARAYKGDKEQALYHLTGWAKNGFKEYWAFTTDFKNKLRGNHHYEHATRYLLWQYENHLRTNEKREPISGQAFLNSISGTDWNSSLDHITPQQPKDSLHSDEFRDLYLNKIGNLSLMPLRLNISKSNKSPESASAYQVSTQLADQEIKRMMDTAGHWSTTEIDERTRRIVQFSEMHWNASN